MEEKKQGGKFTMTEQLKCGCTIENGAFTLENQCQEKNCGECRMIAQMHPFAKKRMVDFLFKM